MGILGLPQSAVRCRVRGTQRVDHLLTGREREGLSRSTRCIPYFQHRTLLKQGERATLTVSSESLTLVLPLACTARSVWLHRGSNCVAPRVLTPYEPPQAGSHISMKTAKAAAPAIYSAYSYWIHQKLFHNRAHVPGFNMPPRVSGAPAHMSTAYTRANGATVLSNFSSPSLGRANLSRAVAGSKRTSEEGSGCSDASGPEPSYVRVSSGYRLLQCKEGFRTSYGGYLTKLEIAYETWGKLNCDKSNAVLLTCGLSASSHAKSTSSNPQKGWWEDFIGSGLALDTERFFVVCVANLGSCYGTTGPSSLYQNTPDEKIKPYGLHFPMFSVQDMVRVMFKVLDHLEIESLHAVVGSSLGGMQSLAAAVMYPHRVKRVVSISAAAASSPLSIALRFIQRQVLALNLSEETTQTCYVSYTLENQVFHLYQLPLDDHLMADPAFNNGEYYESAYPVNGMMLARELATITYRSGPEWSQRFNRQRVLRGRDIKKSDRTAGVETDVVLPPTLGVDFTVEGYLKHQGEKWCHVYDPNSMLLISKAMDHFSLAEINPQTGEVSFAYGLRDVRMPALIIGVKSDILFPLWQQKQMAHALQQAGNKSVAFYTLDSIYGHDTFLIDVANVGAALKGHLEQSHMWRQ